MGHKKAANIYATSLDMGWLGYEGFEKAAMIYRALAYSGYPVTMYNYGNMLAHGRGVKKNIKGAVYWYGKAADQWLVVAMCAKAMFLTYGPEDARDYKTAFELFLRAAESGDETAMYQLGCFYMKGRHVKKDYEKAVQWFRKAVDNGDGYFPELQLARRYHAGRGIPRDEKKARELLSRAIEDGLPEDLYPNWF